MLQPYCTNVPVYLYAAINNALTIIIYTFDTVSSWGGWTSWSACSTTCGRGQRIRVRQCVGRNNCEGMASEMEDCSRPCGPGKQLMNWFNCPLANK